MAQEQAYKALVNVRWQNRATRRFFSVPAGSIVTFDAEDFNEPGGPVTGALISLEDVLERGLFEVYDPSKAGDPDYMSRDELLHLVRAFELGDFPHDTEADVLRPLVAKHLDAAATPASSGKRQRLDEE